LKISECDIGSLDGGGMAFDKLLKALDEDLSLLAPVD